MQFVLLFLRQLNDPCIDLQVFGKTVYICDFHDIGILYEMFGYIVLIAFGQS